MYRNFTDAGVLDTTLPADYDTYIGPLRSINGIGAHQLLGFSV